MFSLSFSCVLHKEQIRVFPCHFFQQKEAKTAAALHRTPQSQAGGGVPIEPRPVGPRHKDNPKGSPWPSTINQQNGRQYIDGREHCKGMVGQY